MDNVVLIGMVSIVMGGLTIAVGSIAPALGEGRALAQALTALAQQPDEANTIIRTLFVGMALVESTAIYCFVITLILIFANPFWAYVTSSVGG
ncbi:MAG: F0F1 ATP synthase subunit C [Cyanobacteria bacterium J06621_11]